MYESRSCELQRHNCSQSFVFSLLSVSLKYCIFDHSSLNAVTIVFDRYWIPNAALAGIIISATPHLTDFHFARWLWHNSKRDFAVWLVAVGGKLAGESHRKMAVAVLISGMRFYSSISGSPRCTSVFVNIRHKPELRAISYFLVLWMICVYSISTDVAAVISE